MELVGLGLKIRPTQHPPYGFSSGLRLRFHIQPPFGSKIFRIKKFRKAPEGIARIALCWQLFTLRLRRVTTD